MSTSSGNRTERTTTFKLGTFNVRGLTQDTKQEQLSRDMNRYKLDVLCIQETKIKELTNIDIEGNRLKPIKTELGLRYVRVKSLNRKHWQKRVSMITAAAYSANTFT